MKVTYPSFGNKWDYMFLNLELLDNHLIKPHVRRTDYNIFRLVSEFDPKDASIWKYSESSDSESLADVYLSESDDEELDIYILQLNDSQSNANNKYFHSGTITKNKLNLYYLHRILSVDHMIDVKHVFKSIDSWLNNAVNNSWESGRRKIKSVIKEWVLDNIISEDNEKYFHVSTIVKNAVEKAKTLLYEEWKILFFWNIYCGKTQMQNYLNELYRSLNGYSHYRGGTNIGKDYFYYLIYHLFNKINVINSFGKANIFHEMFPFVLHITSEFSTYTAPLNSENTKKKVIQLCILICKLLLQQVEHQLEKSDYPEQIQDMINSYLTHQDQIQKLKVDADRDDKS